MQQRITLEDELEELEQVHQTLDNQIVRGYTNYMDDLDLSKMKQQKLIVKRSIEKIRNELGL
jgi:hypothetical protein